MATCVYGILVDAYLTIQRDLYNDAVLWLDTRDSVSCYDN